MPQFVGPAASPGDVVNGVLGVLHLGMFIAMAAVNPSKGSSDGFQAFSNCAIAAGEALQLPAAMLRGTPQGKAVDVAATGATLLGAACLFAAAWWQLKVSTTLLNPHFTQP